MEEASGQGRSGGSETIVVHGTQDRLFQHQPPTAWGAIMGRKCFNSIFQDRRCCAHTKDGTTSTLTRRIEGRVGITFHA